MPSNRFPDSLPKRELRRQDARKLATFRTQHGLSLGFDYCGMPSVEFLDVKEWQDLLRSVCAVELEEEILWDMRIVWDTLGLDTPIRFTGPCNVLDFLCDSDDCYDLYNLDFFGGFLYPNQQGAPRCIEAIRSLVARQASKSRSFVFIATLNVRDKGVRDYLEFIDEIPKALSNWNNVDECCKAHKRSQATRLKLCFPFFCWQVGMTSGFVVRFSDTFIYKSSAHLLHFYAEFLFQDRALPNLASNEVLAGLASRPLLRLEGMIPRIEMLPPEITRP